MPTAMTFTSLLEDLRAYIERGTVVDTTVYEQLPKLVNDAERDIARRLKILGFWEVVTGVMVAGTSIYAKPDRWKRTASINFGVGTNPTQERKPIFPRSYEYCRSYWPNPVLQDEPEFYADYAYTHWLIVPTPDSNYPFEINFWQQPPFLDNDNQTNWLTAYAPDVLRYGALLQCAPFLKNDERIPTWQGLFDSGMQALNIEDLSRIIDRAVAREED